MITSTPVGDHLMKSKFGTETRIQSFLKRSFLGKIYHVQAILKFHIIPRDIRIFVIFCGDGNLKPLSELTFPPKSFMWS